MTVFVVILRSADALGAPAEVRIFFAGGEILAEPLRKASGCSE